MSFEIDMRAVSRVARRVSLAEVRLVDLNLRRTGQDDISKLSADVNRKCIPSKIDRGLIEVSCRYDFSAKASEKEVALISLAYNLKYEVDEAAGEPIEASDVEHFAYANGAYNSWPFARELFHSMTSRMGFPAFVLPVLSFAPPRPLAATAPPAAAATAPPPAAAKAAPAPRKRRSS